MYFLPIILIQNSKVRYQCNKLIVDLFLSSINPIINMGLVMYYQSSECNPLSQKKKKKKKKKFEVINQISNNLLLVT